jgi:maltoporin
MNNTKTLAIVAVLTAATLVVGVTFAATATPSVAFAYKKGQDGRKDKGRDNGNENGNTVTIQAEKQKASVSGFDNNATQEASNVICTHPSTSCVVEGSPSSAATGSTTDDSSDENP